MMAGGYGDRPDVANVLMSHGWLVPGVFVGGCVERGIGSSFRALAHTHLPDDPVWPSWICVRSPKRVLTASGGPSRLLRHEVAHVLSRGTGHTGRRWMAALELVGLRTDPYSAAGRRRRSEARARRSIARVLAGE